ncbi:MAG TPA: hypothetical protein VFL93_15595 [Longimicrobiaceae bacterium]|nr:hypothetical protein [Longimicrobiaceae bacterium]
MSTITGRIRASVEFVGDGPSLRVGDLRLGMNEADELCVTGVSRARALRSLTKERALRELRKIREVFDAMVAVSPELRQFVQEYSVRCKLALETEEGAIGICTEKDGAVQWERELGG